ncbi:hypothetical protein B0H12DRAFT_1111359 [Mycena haematopus]|nr:hypothetical protein B0H12DRAFT_1111359 [Mycena haematopus]
MAAAFQYPPGYLDALARPLVIGLVYPNSNCSLYGIAIAQAAYYFRAFPKDDIFVKIVVGPTENSVIDTIHMIILIQSYNSWFLVDLLAPVLPNMLAEASASTYAMRIWFLSNKNRPITALVVIIVSTDFSRNWTQAFVDHTFLGGLVQVIYLTIHNTFNVFQGSKTFRVSEMVELSSSLACDTLITASMIYFLKGHNSTVQRTSQIVNKIVTYTLSVGMLTTACTAGDFIAWRVSLNTFDFAIPHFALSKGELLNSRVKLRETPYESTAIELSNVDVPN